MKWFRVSVLLLAFWVPLDLTLGARPAASSAVPARAMQVAESHIRDLSSGVADTGLKFGEPYAVIQVHYSALRRYAESQDDDPSEYADAIMYAFPVYGDAGYAGTIRIARRGSNAESGNSIIDTTYVFAGVSPQSSKVDSAVRVITSEVDVRNVGMWEMPWGLRCFIWTSGDNRYVLRVDWLEPEKDVERFRAGQIQPSELHEWAQKMKPRLASAASPKRKGSTGLEAAPEAARFVAQQYVNERWLPSNRRNDPGFPQQVQMEEPFLVWPVGEIGSLDFVSSDLENATVFSEEPTYEFPLVSDGRFLGSILVRRNWSPLGEKWLKNEGQFYVSG